MSTILLPDKTNNGLLNLWRGLPFLFKKGVKRYVLMPLLINIVLFGTLFYFSWDIVGALSHYFSEDSWWGSFANGTLRVVLLTLYLLSISFTFGIITSMIASPFNSLLAGKIEAIIRQQPPQETRLSIKETMRIIRSETGKLVFILLRSLGLLLFSFIPILNIAAPLLWFLFGSKLQTFNYIDYPAGNHGYTFKASRTMLKSHRFFSISFGSCIIILLMIPLVNLFMMPLFVAGASYAWATNIHPQHLKKSPAP